jgi:hypothetical protein
LQSDEWIVDPEILAKEIPIDAVSLLKSFGNVRKNSNRIAETTIDRKCANPGIQIVA